MLPRVHLSRALPGPRLQPIRQQKFFSNDPKQEPDAEYAFFTQPPKTREWEYTPFGMQKVQSPPTAPYEMAPKPDKPPPDAGPGDAEVVSPRQGYKTQPEPRTPANTYFYEDLVDLISVEAVTKKRQSSRDAPADTARARRLGRSVYDAMETHGHFGLVDGGETMAGGVRKLILHVPKRNRGYALDVKVGEAIYANSARGTQARGRLDVLFVSRHKYVPPGHAVTSCAIGVAEEQWRRFVF
jgi:hypothetical protein